MSKIPKNIRDNLMSLLNEEKLVCEKRMHQYHSFLSSDEMINLQSFDLSSRDQKILKYLDHLRQHTEDDFSYILRIITLMKAIENPHPKNYNNFSSMFSDVTSSVPMSSYQGKSLFSRTEPPSTMFATEVSEHNIYDATELERRDSVEHPPTTSRRTSSTSSSYSNDGDDREEEDEAEIHREAAHFKSIGIPQSLPIDIPIEMRRNRNPHQHAFSMAELPTTTTSDRQRHHQSDRNADSTDEITAALSEDLHDELSRTDVPTHEIAASMSRISTSLHRIMSGSVHGDLPPSLYQRAHRKQSSYLS